MADNVSITAGSGTQIATREVPYSGDTANMQVVGLATLSGADDAKEPMDISGSNPMPVEMYGLLNELVKAIDSLRVVDQQQRQRVTIDAITGSLTLGTVTTVSSVGNIAAGTLTNLVSTAGMDREQFINIAAQTYAASIRTQLQFA